MPVSYRRAVLWDSSSILALLDADDAHHAAAVLTAGRIAAERRPTLITNYVWAETYALLLAKLGRAAARKWLLEGALPMTRAEPREEDLGREILAQYDDKDWSLCDAISFAVMETRGIRAAFSYDHHFRQFGRFEVLGLP